LKSQIDNRGLQRFEMRPVFTQVGDDKLVGSAEWVDAAGMHESRFFALTIRDGKIADMQACASMRQAQRFARRARS